MNNRFQKDTLYHDAIAREYDSVVVSPRAVTNNVLFKKFSRLVKPGNRMLDVGCGTGHMIFRFGSRFAEVVGIDHSEGMLEQAKRKALERSVKNITFIKRDVLDYLDHGEKEVFDFVTCVGFLHHLSPERIPEIIRKISNLIRKSGALLLSEPIRIPTNGIPERIRKWNQESWAGKMDCSVNIEEPEEEHLDATLLIQSLINAGLRILRIQRNFEIFPHNSPPSCKDILMIRFLNIVYGRDGNIMTIASQKP